MYEADASIPEISFNFESSGLEIEIETSRLYIRSYQHADFENCVVLYGDQRITKYFDHGKPRSLSEVEEYIEKRGRKYFEKMEPFGLFSIFDKKDMAFVGQVDLLPFDEEEGVLEIGCILHMNYHKQKIGTESVRLLIFNYVNELIARGFSVGRAPIRKVIGTVHPENLGSKKIIENAGMTFDKFGTRFGHPRLWYSIPVPFAQKTGSQ